MVDTLERKAGNRLIASDRVEGTNVYNGENDKLGSIRNIMIDKKSGKAEYAVLEFGGFFGLGSDHYPIPWAMLTYDTDKNGYVVNLTKEQVERAPHYAADREPEYDDVYSRGVYSHYGIAYPLL